MDYYPVFLDLKKRPVVVVGGGKVAEGKVQGLLGAGAVIALVAPRLTDTLRDLVTAGSIRHTPREYDSTDLDGQAMCFVATDDGAINARVAEDCRARGIWVNVADDSSVKLNS